MFSRWVTEDIDFLVSTCRREPSCTSAWARPTATLPVWEHPGRVRHFRPVKPGLAFGNGPHICPACTWPARKCYDRHRGTARSACPTCGSTPTPNRPTFRGFYERGATAHSCPLRCESELMSTPDYSQPRPGASWTRTCPSLPGDRRSRRLPAGMGFRHCFSPRPGGAAASPARPRSSSHATVRTTSSWPRWAVPTGPPWYENLRRCSRCRHTGQVRASRRHRRGTVSDEEKPGLWTIVSDQWPNYHIYQTRTNGSSGRRAE